MHEKRGKERANEESGREGVSKLLGYSIPVRSVGPQHPECYWFPNKSFLSSALDGLLG